MRNKKRPTVQELQERENEALLIVFYISFFLIIGFFACLNIVGII